MVLLDCDCDDQGSNSKQCNSNGQCDCKQNVVGTHCNLCPSLETTGFPTCEGIIFDHEIKLTSILQLICGFIIFLHFQAVIVSLLVLLQSNVILMENAIADITLLGKSVTNADQDSMQEHFLIVYVMLNLILNKGLEISYSQVFSKL